MRIKTNGNKGDTVYNVAKNAEASASIPLGTPVCLVLNATDDGLGVILPSTSAAKAHAFLYGVTTQIMTTGQVSDVQSFGFNRGAVILRGTRATSTDTWASAATLPLGQILNVDTANNAFASSGGTQAVTAYLPFALLAESVNSFASSASATSDTRTAITALQKVYLRIL